MMPKLRSHGFSLSVQVDPDILNRGILVYAITDGYSIKLGRSNGHPRVRLASLQTGNPDHLTLVAYTSGLTERQLHRRYHRSRLRGEWFKITRDLLDELTNWDWIDEAMLMHLKDTILSFRGV